MADLLMPVNYTIIYEDPHRDNAVSEEELRVAREFRFDTLTSPITSAKKLSLKFKIAQAEFQGDQNFKEFGLQLPGWVSSETPLSPGAHVAHLIVQTTPTINLMSSDRQIVELGLQAVVQQVSYAAWCGASNILIQGPPSSTCINSEGIVQYGRLILDVLGAGAGFNVQIRLPMSFEQDLVPHDDAHSPKTPNQSKSPGRGHRKDGALWSSWDVWNIIRTVCKYDPRLSLALVIPKILPPRTLRSRWVSEPTRMLIFPGSSFTLNKKNVKVLSIPHQDYIREYMCAKSPPWIVLSDVGPLPVRPQKDVIHNPTAAEESSFAASSQNDSSQYLEYFRQHIQATHPGLSAEDRAAILYQDFLQTPLQPLADNLESATYEVFEKDKVKYEAYERAIKAALEDWVSGGKPTSHPDGRIVIAIVGAGRGPLVDCAIRAGTALNQLVDIWAVEKNPSAVLHLVRRRSKEWSTRVNLVQSDMRTWKGPASIEGLHYAIDILVSELLGSFGDNELSPECLDGVQHLLNSKDGVCIPTSYSAFMSPIAAPKLHGDLLTRLMNRTTQRDPSQIPYVAWLFSADPLAKSPASAFQQDQTLPIVKEMWTFTHPRHVETFATSDDNRSVTSNRHNRRFAAQSFPCRYRGVCHGIAGYFEAVLYQPASNAPKIELSTNPLTMSEKSPRMKSWFPLFFPLKTPLYIPDHSTLDVSIWRQTDGRRVWYEWLVESSSRLDETAEVRLGCSDLHSSVDAACLI